MRAATGERKQTMTRSTHALFALALFVTVLGHADAAHAQTDPQAPRAPHLDVEIDPLAFLARGFSVHGGFRWDHFRLDLGAFGAEVPGFLASDDRFESRFAGFGLKLDYRFYAEGDGPFVGVSAGRARVTVTHEASGETTDFHQHEVSLRAGWQWDVVAGLYVAPWVSLGYAPDAKGVELGGQQQKAPSKLIVFPTLHLGYRFE